MKKAFLWAIVGLGVAAGLFLGSRGEKVRPAAPGAAAPAQNAAVEEYEKTRRSMLAVMVADLRGPEAPTGTRLVAALNLLEGLAKKGEIRRAGTPEDAAMIEELKRIQREGARDAREAAGRVLGALQ
jgi:hypothetical protein